MVEPPPSSGASVSESARPEPGASAGRTGAGSLILAIAVFVVVVVVSLPRALVPLGFAGGSVDGDWFTLGANLATTGVLGFGEEPLVYRAPGFPAFVALVLKLAFDPARHTAEAVQAIGPTAILLAQSFLLGLSALLLYLWLSRRLSAPSAFAAALVFGANPYSLVVATLIHYDVLNWVLILAFVLALEGAFESRGRAARVTFFVSGLVLAAWALVRPTALIAPLPLLAVFLVRGRGRRPLAAYAFFLAGFLLALAPWTARNFAVTGRFIPVHAQGWTATFASTSTALVQNPDVYQWNIVGRRQYLPLFRRVTGEADITIETYARQIVRLEDAARAAALANLQEKPHIYLANFVSAAVGLTTRVNAVILTLFERVQTRARFEVGWIAGGSGRTLVRGGEAHAFQLLHDLLLLSALFGLGAGLWRKDAFLAVPATLFAALVLAHALTYLDFYYYAVKIPFLVAFGFYGIDLLPRAGRIGLTAAICGLSLALVWAMRFLS